MILIQGTPLPDEIRIALVDMDGTATRRTDALNFEATRRVFGNIGITIDRTTYSLAQGRSREDGIEHILRALNRDDLLADVSLLAEQKNREANIIRGNLTPEDVPREDRRILQRLRDQGFLLALGTTSRNGLDTLNRVRLTSAFDVIVTGNEASIKTEIWQLAFRYLDAKPSQAIVVEDAQTGIDAAVNLGVTFSVGVGSGRLAATVNISSLSELQVERR
ncbi:MAG: HAD family hydrolase [Planctomycetota bacterium]